MQTLVQIYLIFFTVLIFIFICTFVTSMIASVKLRKRKAFSNNEFSQGECANLSGFCIGIILGLIFLPILDPIRLLLNTSDAEALLIIWIAGLWPVSILGEYYSKKRYSSYQVIVQHGEFLRDSDSLENLREEE